MKIRLIAFVAVLGAVALFRTTRFDFLDFENIELDITWDDIARDLWP